MHPGQKIPAAVIGVGYLGKFHAEKYAASEKADLVAVVDEDSARAAEIGSSVGTVGVTDYRELFGRVQCVSIAVPTRLHHQVAKDFITAGIDVLVEKPLAATLNEAKELVELAESQNCILQVGHLERFNPAIRRLEGVIKEPKFVECHRLAPFVERGTDVDVVLDLMIHDIDVIASLVRSPVIRAEAVGVPVLTETPDIANARLSFANGCIANVTASRVSVKRERKVRFFQSDAYISIDYDQRRAQIIYKPAPGAGWLDVRSENIEFKEGDALADEIDSFLDCVRARTAPLVSGIDGLNALEIASLIRDQLCSPRHRQVTYGPWQGDHAGGGRSLRRYARRQLGQSLVEAGSESHILRRRRRRTATYQLRGRIYSGRADGNGAPRIGRKYQKHHCRISSLTPDVADTPAEAPHSH
jgi:predicted dehydrogenase